ncbi:TetR/AcrR family transcriptional regulator [Paenibacillus favisporus]|uniref:TetR/AcrR family transcriptional regulator n=1 Tax=Paenibacillus favisporus TaxID=221028 RepID=UPI003D2728EE
MNAKNTLLEAALSHFAKDGYEGASLQKIAEEVGIKKPSIYAHFKGKDELFLQTLKGALDEEGTRIIRRYISLKDQPLEQRLKGLLEYLQEEYTRSSKTKFVLRMAYFPPSSLHDQVMELVFPFLDSMEKRMIRVMRHHASAGHLPVKDPDGAAVAYMTLIDGVLIEMVCGGMEGSQRRLAASWPVYWAGIHHI